MFKRGGMGNDIWTMNADGSNAAFLYDSGTSDDDPTFSADGQFIFVETGNSIEQIVRIRADGTEPVTLSNAALDDALPATTAGP